MVMLGGSGLSVESSEDLSGSSVVLLVVVFLGKIVSILFSLIVVCICVI